MYVVDTVGELFDKGSRIEKLRNKMAWIKVNTKGRTIADGIERLTGCHKIVGDFSRMNLQAILHAYLLKYIDNGIPATGKILVPALDFNGVAWWEGVEYVPDARSSESCDLSHTECCGCTGSIHKFFCCTLAHSFRLTIAPDVGGKNRLVARVN